MDHIAQSLFNQMRSFDVGGAINSNILGNVAHANKKKVIGFQICGIGNGHLTQAKTMYDILVKHYEIPVVLVYGKKNTNGIRFDASTIFFVPVVSTPESVSNGDVLVTAADYIALRSTRAYEESHNVNLWLNFLVSDICNFRTKQIVIASQFSTKIIHFLMLMCTLEYTSNSKIVSILKPSMLTECVFPPLIDTSTLVWKPEPNRVLCYSVSGEYFPRSLGRIARRHPEYVFDYFLNYTHSYKMPSNVRVHPTSKGVFQKHQQKASAILCTSGNELIQECVLLGIPVASMPCADTQQEQGENLEYYTKKGWCRKMTDQLDITKLVESDVSEQQDEMVKLVEGREEAALKLIEEC